MKLFKLVFLIFLISPFTLYAGEEVLKGTYQGKNLYVQNEFSKDNVSYCIIEVLVNGVKQDGINNSAFEIKLDQMNLKPNQEITVLIRYKDDGCKPKVLNPTVIKNLNTFRFSKFEVTDSKIEWIAENDQPTGIYFLEQFSNNNWVIIKEIKAKPNTGKMNYELPAMHHSGSNQYKVKYQERGSNAFYTNVSEYVSDRAPVTFYPKRVTDKINFSAEVEYEILDAYGVTVRRGKGVEVLCNDLQAGGVYYINFDNKTEKFLKK